MLHVDIAPETWGEFRIDQLFRVAKGSRLKSTDRTPGNIPYVGASQFNNGITHFIGNDEHLHPGGVLTVCYNGPVGTTFYQPVEFWATDDVNVLYPLNEMSAEALLFIAPIIEKIGAKYAYIDKWKIADMKAAIIKLPVDKSSKPDWAYMERVMRSFVEAQESKLSLIEGLADAKPESLNIDTWGEFRIEQLFRVVKGSRLKSTDRTPGNIPYVGASQFNNGITHYIGNDEKIHPGGVLTVCYDGPVGTTFYQPEPFWVTDSVNVLYPHEELSAEVLLFIAPIIQRVGLNFSYNDKWKISDMRTAIIKLPVDALGNPDWDYMEASTRALLEQKASELSIFEQLLPQTEA